ncbi:uncharacterized protein BYT42DRAFT_616654 [Radiomyces spectabilis]|uniref:uncharacterized protein n=1 Tax=Radiomyces spectabilis TaxID=64574 RepID=UPI00221FD25D|nr:uncharacterized protein BYT42DRAFT_616654 [Radiomyces spectabilis]KAI8371569.1 hypothetical protein BYT42DRAFT_616654 [Radiomyces spectabilis]
MEAHSGATTCLSSPSLPRSPTRSNTDDKQMNRLEIENAYLSQQNELLNKELAFARYTINALRTMTLQKDHALQLTRQELEKVYGEIQMFMVLKENALVQPRSGTGRSRVFGDDYDLNIKRSASHRVGVTTTLDIISKLPLRSSTEESQQITPPESPRGNEPNAW